MEGIRDALKTDNPILNGTFRLSMLRDEFNN